MKLNDAVIAVTGAGRGLGQAMAVMLAEQGAKLALIDINEADLAQTLGLVEKAGSQGLAYGCNITEEAAVEATFKRIGDDFGTLNGLINNAGVMRDGMLLKVRDGQVSKMSLEQFQSVINVNVVGTFLCGREAAATMVANGAQGVIVNISSVSRAGNMGQTNYSASKAAVATMAVTWGKELARFGIRTGAIAPGVVKTAMTDQMKPEAIERMESVIPLRRMGLPDEIAHGVKFIFENDYFTARVLEIDGGIRI
ncbi:SDR family oxidoreductase [Gallaecimonas pentaromativorans]|uniref:3-oxoacyl-[acyl-carrier protein] reductase n=1 Tax=Gallaecimonas pentaromativorans TaxID=584787 RepID=A0A3N1PB74_9GAMM|nr:SDR family oxidoreductase [Gallaecimonas pentaromativorans]ROQ25018.1 3-oxoacyl-[acyl-carrier protein] reductase [Gallaecimonas pentaromativorans]